MDDDNEIHTDLSKMSLSNEQNNKRRRDSDEKHEQQTTKTPKIDVYVLSPNFLRRHRPYYDRYSEKTSKLVGDCQGKILKTHYRPREFKGLSSTFSVLEPGEIVSYLKNSRFPGRVSNDAERVVRMIMRFKVPRVVVFLILEYLEHRYPVYSIDSGSSSVTTKIINNMSISSPLDIVAARCDGRRFAIGTTVYPSTNGYNPVRLLCVYNLEDDSRLTIDVTEFGSMCHLVYSPRMDEVACLFYGTKPVTYSLVIFRETPDRIKVMRVISMVRFHFPVSRALCYNRSGSRISCLTDTKLLTFDARSDGECHSTVREELKQEIVDQINMHTEREMKETERAPDYRFVPLMRPLEPCVDWTVNDNRICCYIYKNEDEVWWFDYEYCLFRFNIKTNEKNLVMNASSIDPNIIRRSSNVLSMCACLDFRIVVVSFDRTIIIIDTEKLTLHARAVRSTGVVRINETGDLVGILDTDDNRVSIYNTDSAQYVHGTYIQEVSSRGKCTFWMAGQGIVTFSVGESKHDPYMLPPTALIRYERVSPPLVVYDLLKPPQ